MKKSYSILFCALSFFIAQNIFAQCGPTISCPSNITVNNTTGICGAVVNYPPATASTTCVGTTTVYSETFQAGVGAWTLNVNTGTNAATPNSWEVNASEGGVTPPGCGVANNGDLTLHVTCTSAFCGTLITGAVYNAAKTSNKRAESPLINTTGYSNLTLNFDFISNGDGLLDNASVLYNDGSGWQVLTASIKSPVCGGGQGQWTAYTATLPVSCENNPNLQIGFNWTNNNDNVGTDPSIAINNITITSPVASPPVITYNYPSGSLFPVGTTNVIATATDALNNMASCSFQVTVNDIQPPVINSCPADITVPVNNAGCTAIVNWTAPTATDNCASPLLTSTSNSGSVFPVGTTPVTYTATDASGNSTTCSFNVTVTNNLAATATSTDAQCFNTSTCSAMMNVSGGQPSYSYSWSPSGGTAALANNLSAGTYSCTATDANGCSVTNTVTVNNPAPIAGSQSVTICSGQSVTVGTSVYTTAGVHVDVLTSASGCDSTVTTTIAVNPLPVVTINSTMAALECEGHTDTLVASGALNYSWSTSSTNDTIFVVQSPGTTQWIVVGTDGNGCSNSDTANVIVSALTPINMNMSSIDTQCVSISFVDLTNVCSPSGGTWTGPGVTGMSFDPASAGVGTHTLMYSVTNVDGCVSSATGTIYVDVCTGMNNSVTENQIDLYPNPNNGDFILETGGKALVEIYNSIGELVLSENLVAGKNSLSLGNAANGIYLVKISSNDNVKLIRVVKGN